MAKRAPDGDRASTDEMRETTEPERHESARDERRPEVERDETFDPSSRGEEFGEVT